MNSRTESKLSAVASRSNPRRKVLNRAPCGAKREVAAKRTRNERSPGLNDNVETLPKKLPARNNSPVSKDSTSRRIVRNEGSACGAKPGS